ncbi:MAG: RNA polymerase sigma factor [Candidatus Peregrinibacteria bacterium]|nr:RNA polymerase sigma factor [Candidatus Peregrinibacteria bacterium]MCB9808115.1 RNA polymerase sigma factor [Candidatus Peribacteria bacterium]
MEGSIDIQQKVLPEYVRRAKEGDTESFAKIYDMFFVQVYRYTAFRVPKEVAEDLVADIFVKAWEKLHTYQERKNVPFGAWLFRIARHTVIDAYRTHRGFDEVPETLVDTDVFNRADTKLGRDEMLSIVNRSLDTLPERYREILLLSYMADLPHTEIARVLRLTEGAVRILKHRALKKLEDHLPENIREYRAVYAV